jgi:D-3-phosphoglycerate dehydrogenase
MSPDAKSAVTICVPDDFPSVFDGTPAHERCRKLGETRVFTARGADEEAELIKRIDHARIAINIRAHARFTDSVMAACRKLEMISIWGTGTDNIDLDAAGRHGITVCNTPGINAFAVAEHALALMLASARRIPRIDREVRGGAWPRDLLTQLLGKTLGVCGTGKIGARVIALGNALGMDVLAYSARGDAAAVAALGARAASKEDICRRADVISLHLRARPGHARVSRPARVRDDEADGDSDQHRPRCLGRARSAAGRAHTEQDRWSRARCLPRRAVEAGDPFLALPSVVLSPHNGGQTPEVIRDGLLRAIENVENYLAGKATDTVVAPVKARR